MVLLGGCGGSCPPTPVDGEEPDVNGVGGRIGRWTDTCINGWGDG